MSDDTSALIFTKRMRIPVHNVFDIKVFRFSLKSFLKSTIIEKIYKIIDVFDISVKKKKKDAFF